jgi:hypothetical protein
LSRDSSRRVRFSKIPFHLGDFMFNMSKRVLNVVYFVCNLGGFGYYANCSFTVLTPNHLNVSRSGECIGVTGKLGCVQLFIMESGLKR